MTNARKFLWVAALTPAALIFAACGSDTDGEGSSQTETYHAAYPEYASYADLRTKADLIVKGTVTGQEVRQINILDQSASDDPNLNPQAGAKTPLDADYVTYTVYTVKVSKVLKGDAKPGDAIEVKQLGGTDGSKASVLADAAPLTKGAPQVLFLSTYDASPATLVNQNQAVYTAGVDGKFRAASRGNAIAAEVLANLEAAGIPVEK